VLRLLQPNLWQAMQLLQGESGLGIGEVQDWVEYEPVSYIAMWMLILDSQGTEHCVKGSFNRKVRCYGKHLFVLIVCKTVIDPSFAYYIF
jgi:hypothetical protein